MHTGRARRPWPGPALALLLAVTGCAGEDARPASSPAASNTVYAVSAAGALPTLHDGPAVEVVLRRRPARCDVHALGESHRTGLVELVVALGRPRPGGWWSRRTRRSAAGWRRSRWTPAGRVRTERGRR